MTLKIIVSGPRGRMGKEAINMILNEENMELVACIDRINNGKMLADIDGMPDVHVPIFVDSKQCFESIKADIFLELSIPDVAFTHTVNALKNGLRAVVGTSGLTKEQIHDLKILAFEKELGCIIAPNFAIGAVLMMQFAQKAARYFPDIEIIEKHHDKKLDAPSGTAIKTLDMILETREDKEQGHPNEKETLQGARGANQSGVHIHSVRLPGLIAHQEVIFGGLGQTLTITHDSYNRQSFMTGVKFALNKVNELTELVYGMENILD
ncbi:4-hydroxy-tetrahydrodipicolinate reductase [Cerasibacillus quisquiliarum]|uniref:4-hydroxy-tetrahydrodipicolinate reductase n=1 Tax=Cerasibacillus quisquiliarum TaxID=227865 RepID=A0A511UYT0_9BACI|nr:4-hydroxy-tetrahydrodipicolinate reductase [Cerasibacillus quisquiliarum]MBB5145360.1 4-hydroxy-tetrahydrodipicolinate reductase [Cerasibacillus quisquiliarum]GEN31796.1 4-hydroxy-tetrahydrodipicolinate reductase [Cerasibacillus quisquiliarum]